MSDGRHDVMAFSGDVVDILRDVIAECVSPDAVRAMAEILSAAPDNPHRTEQVQVEIDWFVSQLWQMVIAECMSPDAVRADG